MFNKSNLILLLSIVLLLYGCPDPPEETFCGQGMVLDADTCACIPNAHLGDDGESCECDSLHHWNEDLTECVLDTTNHEILWTIDTLGTSGSYLNDAAIISGDNIWVVGQIVIPDPDSSYNGTGKENFNSAHWNGVEWELHTIWSGTLPLSSILYFSDNDIWVTSGFPIHWDGEEWTLYHLQDMGLPVSVDDMWGNSSSNLYFVGRSGSLVHFDGIQFIQIESGTNARLAHITANGEDDIWVSGWNDITSNAINALLHYDGSSWQKVFDYWLSEGNQTNSPINGFIYGTHISTYPYIYLVTSRGNYWCNRSDFSDCYRDESTNANVTIEDVAGTAPNDIFYGGHFTRLYHFNGKTTKQYTELDYSGIITSINVKEDLVVLTTDAQTPFCQIIRGARD